MSKAVFYASNTGNTKDVARLIADELSIAEVYDIADTDIQKINEYDTVIIGTSTWGDGDLQDDLDNLWEDFCALDFSGKKVALFGLGDQEEYCDHFVDAMGKVYEQVVKAGAQVAGSTSIDGYEHEESLAQKNDEFVGLVIDEDNQPELTDERVKKWCEELRSSL